MQATQSHDQFTPDQEWITCGNSSASVDIARGDVVVWDLASLPATSSGKRGVYVQQSGATANLTTVAGVAEEPLGKADYTLLGRIQRLGYFDAVKFSGTAAQRRLTTIATAGTATVVAAGALAGEVAFSTFGLCVTNGGTPATVEAILDVHL